MKYAITDRARVRHMVVGAGSLNPTLRCTLAMPRAHWAYATWRRHGHLPVCGHCTRDAEREKNERRKERTRRRVARPR